MTPYDTDTALDALLGQADDAVLSAVQDGLDLTAGRRALRPNSGVLERSMQLMTVWAASVHDNLQFRGPDGPPCENGLLVELLAVLNEAGRAARILQSSLESPAYGEMLLGVAMRLRMLADTARQRKADGPPTLRTLEQSREIVAQIRDSLANVDGLDGVEVDGLADRFAVLDDLLTRAHALVVRLFADDGEPSFLPVPAR